MYDDSPDRKDQDQEKYMFSQVLERYSINISEIEKAYGLILDLLKIFKSIYPSVDASLDGYYQDLFKIVDEGIDRIREEIHSKYSDENDGGGNLLPSFYIKLDVYEYLYKPYENLYEPQLNKIHLDDWEEVQIKLNACYAQMEDFSKEHKSDKKVVLPHQALFDKVGEYIDKNKKLEDKDVMQQEYALRLQQDGGNIYIVGSVTSNERILLCRTKGGSSSILLDLTIKSCVNKPAEFKIITKGLLASKNNTTVSDFDDAIKKISIFKSYISNIGLRGVLKDCFYGNDARGLGFKFRVAMPMNEWINIPNSEQNDIKNNLVNIKNKKAS